MTKAALQRLTGFNHSVTDSRHDEVTSIEPDPLLLLFFFFFFWTAAADEDTVGRASVTLLSFAAFQCSMHLCNISVVCNDI